MVLPISQAMTENSCVFRFWTKKPAQAMNSTFSVLTLKLSSKVRRGVSREAATYITSISLC